MKKILALSIVSVVLMSSAGKETAASETQRPDWQRPRGVRIDGVVAVVGGEAITQGEIDRWVSPASAPTERADILQRLVDKKVVLKEAERKGLRLTESDLDAALDDVQRRNGLPTREALKAAIVAGGVGSWDDYLDDIRYQMTLLRLAGEEISGVAVTQEEVRRNHEADPNRWMTDEEVHLDQLLFRDPGGGDRAGLALQAAQKGEAFESLAQTHSSEASDLGRFSLADLSPEIRAAVASLAVGAVSPPVQTDAGIHLFRVREKIASRPLAFEEVEPEIRQRLLAEKQAAAQMAWLAGLRQTIHVETRDLSSP